LALSSVRDSRQVSTHLSYWFDVFLRQQAENQGEAFVAVSQAVRIAAIRWLGWACASLLAATAWAQSPDPAQQELIRQQERERALREQQEAGRDVRLERQAGDAPIRLPSAETPCFPIERLELTGEASARFAWALQAANPADDPATGRCLGTEGINVVMGRIQNAIIARGYVTTRVLAAPQDLKSGTLALIVVPGRIHAVRFAEGTASRATAWNAISAQPGDLLNLRDIEQALENFQRIPTVSADIQIVPAEGEAPGLSDLVISWQQRSRVRANVSLDDSGSQATGQLQAGATLSLDDLLNWNDLFYVNIGHAVFNAHGKGTASWTTHYDVPFGYWAVGATASKYDYRQTVIGPFQRYVYSGGSRNAELRVSRLLLRTASSKIGVYGRGWWRTSDNFIDDTEIEVQRRRTAGWELGLTHKRYLGKATLDASAGYRRGTGAFNALPAPEELFGEGTSRFQLITAEAQFSLPMQWGHQQLRYGAAWRGQWNRSLLTPQDRFAIGGRYTVRGFDGEAALTGERGWLLRNDLELSLGGGQQAYVAVDYGHVGGPSNRWQPGNHLAGLALGLRGNWKGLGWDGFVGAPLSSPDGFPTAYTTLGFSMNWSF
jgi:hemolysin activation/secretion protein